MKTDKAAYCRGLSKKTDLTDEEIDAVVGQYSRWKFEFPGSVIPVDPKAERIERIKTEIEALKRQLKELGEKSG